MTYGSNNIHTSNTSSGQNASSKSSSIISRSSQRPDPRDVHLFLEPQKIPVIKISKLQNFLESWYFMHSIVIRSQQLTHQSVPHSRKHSYLSYARLRERKRRCAIDVSERDRSLWQGTLRDRGAPLNSPLPPLNLIALWQMHSGYQRRPYFTSKPSRRQLALMPLGARRPL